jgi:phosphoglycerate dehydrogenase-like enzyme
MAVKIVILSPNADLLFTDELKRDITAAGEAVFIKEIKPLLDVLELYNSEQKIVAIDPDFCEWNVPREVIEKMKNVQAICLQTTSFSWIDIAEAKKQGIPVMNLRGFSKEAVAEWAFMMAINVARKLPLIIKDGWKQDFSKHQGLELKGKTVGIVGLGTIGSRIAEICNGLGMEVIYWSRSSKDERFSFVELDDLMKRADFIFPTLAQNEETIGLITDEMLKSMKSSAIFVSIVHKIYNHDLVLQLVKEGKLYGYAFETQKEKIADFEGNVWAGPELAWCTNESFRRNVEQWTESIVKAVNNDYLMQVNK